MKDFLTFIFILLFHNVSFNQTLNGQIVELDDDIPIGYASLGVLHQNKGTVADSNGYFHFDLSNFSELDTLVISAIGFEKMEFLISHCKTILLNQEILRIELTPTTKELQEVIVTAGKYKNLITGNNIKSSMIIAGFQNRSLGAEMGTILKYNKEKKGLLTNLHFNVVANQSDTIKFRVNLYEIENGIPNESILNEPIYFYGTPTNGSITINVSERRIYLKKDIFVTVELIENVGMDGLFFKSAFLRSASYFRDAPEGNWVKANVDLGIWAEIQYKK
jgi:hypothetical protein